MPARARYLYRRIHNIRHVRQITSAMYTIAATQVIQRRKALTAARPFSEAALPLLAGLAATLRQESLHVDLLHGVNAPGQGLVVVNSDRGLCGRYVGDINEAAEKFAKAHPQVLLLLGGDKAYRPFRRRPWRIVRTYLRSYDRPSPAFARQVAEDLVELYGRDVGEVHAVYMHFRGELVQKVRVERLLPLPVPEAQPLNLLVEPALEEVAQGLARTVLVGRLLEIFLHAKTAEHAIRREAMKAATDNADELLEKLVVQYNKARQHRITAELADIMGGAEALREE